MKQVICINVLHRLLGDAYFSELRTEKQLGYAVFLRPIIFNNTASLLFVVQSPTASEEEIKEAIFEFKKVTGRKIVKELVASKLKMVVDAMSTELGMPIEQMSEEAGINWHELKRGCGEIDSKKMELDMLKKLTVKDVKVFYNWHIDRDKRKQRSPMKEYQEMWIVVK